MITPLELIFTFVKNCWLSLLVRALLACLLLFVVVSCGGGKKSSGGGNEPEPDPEKEMVTLLGSVLLADMSALEGVQVVLKDVSRGITYQEGSDNSMPSELAVTETDASGNYSFEIEVPEGIDRVEYQAYAFYNVEELPEQVNVASVLLDFPLDSKSASFGTMLFVDVGLTELLIQADGAAGDLEQAGVQLASIPEEVDRIWAQHFDPDDDIEFFPGDFIDSDSDPLNSSGFIQLFAQDEDGNAVTDFGTDSVTVMFEIDYQQWPDLIDLEEGNNQIDLPMYSFDEELGEWVREPNASGYLVSLDGQTIPETEADNIINQSYNGRVFAKFEASHFSWWNVDYAYHSDIWNGFDGHDGSSSSSYEYGSHVGYPEIRHGSASGVNGGVWFGHLFSLETVSRNPDTYEDGLLNCSPLEVRINNLMPSGQSEEVFVNVVIDYNNDGDWDDAGEWVVQNVSKLISYRTGEALGLGNIVWQAGQNLRMTVTPESIANYNGSGIYDFGETEDYNGCARIIDITLNNYRSIYDPQVNVSFLPDGVNTYQCSYYNGSDCEFTITNLNNIQLTATRSDGTPVDVAWSSDFPDILDAKCKTVENKQSCSFDDGFDFDSLPKKIEIEVTFPPVRTINATTYGLGEIQSDTQYSCELYEFYCRTEFLEGVDEFPTELIAIPEDGWAFNYWLAGRGLANCDNSTSPICAVNYPNGELYGYITAVFERRGNVEFIVDGQGTVSGEIDCAPETTPCALIGSDYSAGETATVTAAARDNYEFDEWIGCPLVDGLNCIFDFGEYGKFITAKFIPQVKTVNVETTEGGKVFYDIFTCEQESNCEYNVDFGETIQLTPSPLPGYDFVRWEGCSATDSENHCEVSVGADGNSVKAIFAVTTVPFLVSATVGGEVIIEIVPDNAANPSCDFDVPCSLQPEFGSSLTLKAEPFDGYVFNGWTGCSSPNGATCVELVDNANGESVLANFIEELDDTNGFATVSFTVMEGGRVVQSTVNPLIDCPGTCEASFLAGNEFLFSAIPDEGYVFDRWAGVCEMSKFGATEPTCAFDVASANTTYASEAIFSVYEVPETLTFTVRFGFGDGSVNVYIENVLNECHTEGNEQNMCVFEFSPDDFIHFELVGEEGSPFVPPAECSFDAGFYYCDNSFTEDVIIDVSFQETLPLPIDEGFALLGTWQSGCFVDVESDSPVYLITHITFADDDVVTGYSDFYTDSSCTMAANPATVSYEGVYTPKTDVYFTPDLQLLNTVEIDKVDVYVDGFNIPSDPDPFVVGYLIDDTNQLFFTEENGDGTTVEWDKPLTEVLIQ